MKLIGKMENLLLFEVDKGKYIIVNPSTGRCDVQWNWYGQLGKWCDSFTKCSEDPLEKECLEAIHKNSKKIVEALNKIGKAKRTDIYDLFMSEQEKFYDSLEEGEEYNF